VACEAERQALQEAEDLLADLQADCASGIHTACAAARVQFGRVQAARQRLDKCLAPPRSLVIVGVERTQATQFFLSNGQGSSAGADNSVPLVAQKATAFRVYVDRRSITGQPVPVTVTGSLTVAGSALVPSNGPIPATPASSIDRGNANHTLNFWLSPALCQGTKSFTLTVFDPAHPGDPAYASAPLSFSATFDAVPQVRVHGVLVHYTGRGLNITAPTGLDLVTTLTWVNQTYPISGFNYTGCTVIDFDGDLTVNGGPGCGTGWNQLFNRIANMRSTSGTTDVYVALLPTGVPTGNVGGCGGGGVAIAYVGAGPTFAQEIGHAFGRQHAPCGNPGSPDPNYPTYDSYPSGSIGEFGLDTGSFQIYNPATTFDFMSYCGPAWVSPYTYVGLKNAIAAAPAAAHPERAEVRDVSGEYLYLNFRVHRDGNVELLPSFHLEGPAPGPELRPPSSMWCDLIGPEGQLIESHQCHFRDPHQSPDALYMDYHEAVRWDPAVEAIVFRRDGEEIHRQEVEETPPNIRMQASKRTERRTDLMRVEWTSEGPREPLSHLLRYSNDEGRSWRTVATDLAEPRHVANLELLPGGDRCRFQVVASAGVRTAVTETEPFAIPVKPVQVHILSPTDGTLVTEGEPLTLRGGGFSPDFGTTAFEDVVWTSSRDGPLGIGYETLVQNLSVGRHRIKLTVPDGLGGEAAGIVSVEVASKA
jgi:hypothetical protein